MADPETRVTDPEARVVHPIEQESFRRLRARLDTSHFPPLTRAVVERVIHSAADLDYATDLVTDEGALEEAHRALHDGASVVVDVEMVAAGITRRDTVCRLKDAVSGPGLTRSAHAIRLAYEQVGPGALWVIGCAPTALEELLTLDAAPALVIGLPVGFVGAAESKAALRESGLPAVSNVSEKGGSAVAAAALNALLYHPVSHPESHSVSDPEFPSVAQAESRAGSPSKSKEKS
ncbi:precorrin-8X methylmutase [Streptomyces sp. ActVer]|uniref:precorrin-8X methylmutase n=1 Tax=Streptomyces sp. ActVer TaxID=3014558 RepID=UPI0022B48C12|nr:precorrin-8X methylmutase [Streptomyces sp. ActVer]MCZ4512301.1 precorrin-8X methylmutase [Streptomyces sp. ActVer]